MPYQDDLDFEADVDDGSSLAPFVWGALVGAGAALLLAPTDGAEARRRVGSWLGRLAEVGPAGAADSARASVNGWVERAREGAAGGVDSVRGAVEGQVDRVRDAFDEGRVAARETAEELRRTIDEAKQAYRAGSAGTPPPRGAPQPRLVAEEPAAAEEVVVLDAPIDDAPGDLAR
jgi:gas vesicle protein